MYLNQAVQGIEYEVVELNSQGKLLSKLLDMGFVKGAKLKLLRSAPLKDPIEIKIQGSLISLRKDEADKIEVIECKK